MKLKESINQNQINLLKATYGDIKKINPNSPAAKKLMMALKKLSKDDLETISKAKINFVSTMAQSILRDSNVPESIQEGKKRFNTKYGVGKSKYVVSYHDGVKKHKDGSDFFDIQIFKNQKDLDTFKKALLQKGFIEESVNEAIAVGKMVKVVDNPHWEASLGKKGPFKRKVKMIDGDNVFFTDGSNSSMKYVKEDTQLTNEADLNWNAVQNAIINFLKVNTKILDKKVQAKDTEGVKGGLKSIISGLTNAQRSLNLESVNEAVSFKDGKYHFYSKNEVAYLTYGGKEISSGDWDVDADAYFMNHSSWKGQKAFDDGKDVIRYFKKNNIITESSKDDILKDLDKAKTDLLKKVEVLIAKKKKLYSNVDITTPMSADEKKLDKDIADLFSQINTLVLQKRDINRKSVNEAKKSKDVKGIRAVEAVSNNVDAIIDLVLYENRDPKEVIDTMVPVLLNAIKETIKHKYKPSSADPSNAKKLNEFLSEIKKFQKLVEDLLNRPSKAGVKRIEDAWKNIWNHKHGANIILNGKWHDSIIESAKKSTFTKVAHISNNGKLDIY